MHGGGKGRKKASRIRPTILRHLNHLGESRLLLASLKFVQIEPRVRAVIPNLRILNIILVLTFLFLFFPMLLKSRSIVGAKAYKK